MYKATFKAVHGRKKGDGVTPVEVYCYLDGRKRYISTGVFIEAKHWDAKRQRVKDTHQGHYRYNKLIRDTIDKLERLEFDAIDNRGSFSLDDIRKSKTDPLGFPSWVKREVELDNSVSPSTKGYRIYMAKMLLECLGDIPFKSFRYEHVLQFESYMIEKGLGVSTRQKYHNQLRRVSQEAVKHGKLKENPYVHYKIKRASPPLKYVLWPDHLDAIWQLQHPSRGYGLTKMKFLFSCYTGLRISDNNNLAWDMIVGGKIIFKSQKTGAPTIIPLDYLSSRTGLILQNFNKKSPLVFPRISEKVMRDHLKQIAVDAQIPFPITFHTSRHTFCTLVAHKSGSVFKVMELAGIRKTETAMTYVNLSRAYY